MIKERKFDFRYFFPLAVSVGSLFVQGGMLLFYLCGMATLFGENVTPWGAIQFVIQMFSFNPASSFQSVMGLFAAVFYYLFLGFIIKDFCVGILNCLDLKESRFSLRDRKFNSDRFSKIMYECFLSFEFVCLYLIFIGFNGGRVHLWAVIPVMVMTGAVFVGRGIVLHIFQFGAQDLTDAIPDACKDSLVFFGLCLFVFLYQTPLLKDFLAGFYFLLNGALVSQGSSFFRMLGALYFDLAFPICVFVSLGFYFVVLHEYLPHSMRRNQILPRVKSFLIFSGIMTVIHFIFECLFEEGIDFMVFANWFMEVRSYFLPMTILLCVMLFLEKRYKTVRQIS